MTQSIPQKQRVKVRFFASLSEQLGLRDLQLEVPAGASVGAVWALAVPDRPMPANVLSARNMAYCNPAERVEDGDEIAFFPPVTGGGT